MNGNLLNVRRGVLLVLLREIFGEHRTIAVKTESRQLDGSLIRAVDTTENQLAELTDVVTVRVVLLFLAFFTLLVVARWISLRLKSRLHEPRYDDQKSSSTGSPS